MRRTSLIIIACLLMALVLTVYGQQRELQPIMKEIQPTQAAINTGFTNRVPAADLAKDADKLSGLFKEVQSYMKTKNISQAEKWAGDASNVASDLAKATRANDYEAMKTAKNNLGKVCKQCHDVHREQLPDKSFKLKGGN